MKISVAFSIVSLLRNKTTLCKASTNRSLLLSHLTNFRSITGVVRSEFGHVSGLVCLSF
jgi:Mg2+/Co2+ transporter CorC